MKYRNLGSSELSLSTVSMGCWAIGGSWGKVSDEASRQALSRAVDLGINFFDTADVYGDGRSERLVGQLLKERSETLYVATKAGRRLDPHLTGGYNRENLSAFLERSLKNLGVERVDLLQLHCPPREVFYRPEVFGILDDLVQAGKLRHYGVSVEKVEEGLMALEYPGVRSIQIIFNPFRQRPAERLLARAHAQGVGVLARVPLASGLLTGKFSLQSTFESDDHRTFNRQGQAFDVGETFAGVPWQQGLQAVEQLRQHVPQQFSLADLSLRWILDHEAVTCVIPGAKSGQQVAENARASELPSLDSSTTQAVDAIYRAMIAPHVHLRW